MALDDSYIVGVNLGEYFVDKTTGEPLSGGTISFYRDSNRLVGKNVYQLTGSPDSYTYTSLSNSMTLSSVGTPVNGANENVAIYFYPFDDNGDIDNYYIVVKDSDGTTQFTRQAWPNLTPGNNPENSTNGVVTNELGNPQFVDVWFNPNEPLVHQLTFSRQDIDIGPDWALEVTGSIGSTTTIKRVALAGNLQAPQTPSGAQAVNAPYCLEIQPSAGITKLTLRQRLDNNPGLFTGKDNTVSYLSSYLIAKSETSNGDSVSMSLRESSGGSLINLGTVSLLTSGFSELKNSVAITNSNNSQTGDVGYVDILVDLPLNGTTRVTSIQVVGMDSDDTPAFYDTQPVNRQIDHTWHNYKEQVIVYPKDTILTGWQFGVNPWQIRSKTVSPVGNTLEGTTYPAYTADQTIIVQEFPNQLNAGRATGSSHVSQLLITPHSGTQGRFAIVQYVDKSIARPYWGYNVSSLVRGIFNNTGSGGSLKFKMRILRRDSAPTTLSPISAWGPTLTYTSGWTEAAPLNDPEYTFETSQATNLAGLGAFPHYSFNQMFMDLANSINTRYLAVVLYISDVSGGALSGSDALSIDDISLVPNDFAIAVNPKTFDESLSNCQYYFEKTWVPGANVGTATAVGRRAVPLEVRHAGGLASFDSLYLSSFNVPYKTKNKNPTITFYSPTTGTQGKLNLSLLRNASNPPLNPPASGGGVLSVNPSDINVSGNFTLTNQSLHNSYMQCNVTSTKQMQTAAFQHGDEGFIFYHATFDSRL